MDNKPTQDLATRAFQKRVLDEFAAVRAEQAEKRFAFPRQHQLSAIDQRLTSVEDRLLSLDDKVDSRLRETRPIWEAVQQQLKKLDKKFDLAIKDLFELRSDVATQDKRIGDLEHRILAS